MGRHRCRCPAGVTILFLVSCAVGAVVASGREPPLAIDLAIDASVVIPPADTHYKGREIAQTMHYTGAPWLVRESRQREEDCRLLLEALDIREGQAVCDLGCGNGFYTLEIARHSRTAGEGLCL